MLGFWVVSFVVGALVGRAGQLPYADVRVVVLGAAALGFLGVKQAERARAAGNELAVSGCGVRHRAAYALWIVCAFIWGAVHAAPFPKVPLHEARVTQTVRSDAASGPIIVVAPDGARYEANGPQRLALAGSVTLKPLRRLFSAARPVFKPSLSSDARLAPIDGLARLVTDTLTFRLSTVPAPLRAWVLAIVLGQSKGLATTLQRAFLETGLIHLLVVSGSHVAFFGFLLSLVLRFPGQLAYAVRLISARRFRHFSSAALVLSAGVGVVYSAATGFSVPSQRAVIVFVLWQLGKAFGGVLPKVSCLLLAAFLQTLFYPIGFVSESCLMSWCAFLLVIAALAPRDEHGDFWQRLGRSCALQGEILVVAGVVFGNVSLMSFVANLVVAPLFPFLLTGALLALIMPTFPLSGAIWTFHEKTLVLVKALAGQTPLFGGNLLEESPHATCLRVLLVLPATLLLLNACRKLSISRYAAD